MKHIVQRYWSVLIPDMPYSCPGFGDIVHSCLLTYLYGQAHGEPATLHIASHQYNRDKPEIWAEVQRLFPDNTVHVQHHSTKHKTYTDLEFMQLVQNKYPEAVLHYYKKYPGKLQQVLKPSFYVDEYMANYAQLPGKIPENPVTLPARFATWQVDAGSKGRHLLPEQLDQIRQKFANLGCEIVTVGGEAEDPRLRTAAHAGYAMSRAAYHIGVDSGYMHLAQLYFKPEDIYLYTNKDPGKWLHHLNMARDHGCRINDY